MESAHALVTRLSKHFDYRRPGKVVVLVLVQATSGHVIRPPGVKISLVYLQQIDPLSAQQSQVLIQLGAQGVGRAIEFLVTEVPQLCGEEEPGVLVGEGRAVDGLRHALAVEGGCVEVGQTGVDPETDGGDPVGEG